MGQVWLIHPQLVRFEDSVNRCLSDRAFVHRFYQRFLASDPEVQAKFEGVDLDRQGRMLADSLRLVLGAARGTEAGRAHLEHIAERHSARGLGIEPHLYQRWLDALVSVAAETDPEWDESLGDVWRAALQPCIDAMIRHA